MIDRPDSPIEIDVASDAFGTDDYTVTLTTSAAHECGEFVSSAVSPLGAGVCLTP